MPRLCTLEPHHIQLCDNTLQSRGLIAPNRALLAAIIIKDPTLVRLLVTGYKKQTTKEWEDRFGRKPTLDTYEREYLLDAISREYTDMSWPCNCDSDRHTEQFINQLTENASKSGWVFNS